MIHYVFKLFIIQLIRLGVAKKIWVRGSRTWAATHTTFRFTTELLGEFSPYGGETLKIQIPQESKAPVISNQPVPLALFNSRPLEP